MRTRRSFFANKVEFLREIDGVTFCRDSSINKQIFCRLCEVERNRKDSSVNDIGYKRGAQMKFVFTKRRGIKIRKNEKVFLFRAINW